MRKLLFSMRSSFLGLKLKNKLMVSYVIIFALPLCFFTFYTFWSFSSVLKNNTISSVEKNFNQTYSFLTDKIDKVSNTSDIVMTNENIENIFSLKENANWQGGNYYLIKQSMNFLCSLENKDITRIVLFLYQDEPDPNLSYNYNSVSNVSASIWYKEMTQKGLTQLWCPTSYLANGSTSLEALNQSSFGFIRNFNDPTNYSKRLGFLCVYFSASQIESIIDQADTIGGSIAFLQNSKGDLVYDTGSSQQPLYQNYAKRTDVRSLTQMLKTCKINGKDMIYAEKQLNDTDWNFVILVPYETILSQIRKTQTNLALLTVVISLLSLLVAWKISNSITVRISLLEKKMKSAERGDLAPLENTPYTDEVGHLYNSYNYMTNQIERLMNEKYKDGIHVKSAELKALQSQINPHFLYNTLDTIHWLAQKNSIEEVEMAISSLATFYKLSLSKGKDEIPLEVELRHVSSYVQIQNIRFSYGIKIIYDMDEELAKYFVLKLLLQPLVENSILYGIMNKPSKEGTIIIKAVPENGNIHIIMQDDGVGIPEEQIKKINAGEQEPETGSGYGIKNVQQRIHLFYGQQYGMTFSSVYGHGTVVDIIIPANPSSETETD